MQVSATAHQVTQWAHNKAGAVSITFDDGFRSQYTMAVPALNARGFKGSFFLITDIVDRSLNRRYYASWDEWRNVASQGHEIGSHTKTHPHLPELSLAEMEGEIGEPQDIIDNQITTQQCLTFVYPFADYDANARAFARDYYIAARGVWCRLNAAPYNFYGMSGCGDSDSLEEMKSYADAAEQQGDWLITIHHSLDGTGYGLWTIDTFIAYLDYLETKNVWVDKFGSVVKYIKERESANLSLVSSSDNQIVLSLTDALDDTIFDEPLTIRSEVPSGWNEVSVQQGTGSITVLPVVEETRTVIYYNVIPDRGFIALQKLATNQHTLTVGKSGTGSGTLSAPGLNCTDNTCKGKYTYSETIHINAKASSESILAGWSGCDSVTDDVCTVLIDRDRDVTAILQRVHTLVVSHEGTGDGKISSVPSGIDCKPACSDTFIVGTPVRLTALPYDGSVFAYWSGGCAGTTETCDLQMTDYIEVAAHYVPYGTKEYKLKVKRVNKNQGDGVVTSNDRNIDCGNTCSHTYYKDTIVTLSATPNQGSTFLGWKPETPTCTGTDPCTVAIDKATTVQALFVGDYMLKVIAQGKKGAAGLVSSTPFGISCLTGITTGCEAFYGYGQEVTLSASADSGSTFLGWAPAKGCPGNGVCIVPMDKKRTVKAVFSRQ